MDRPNYSPHPNAYSDQDDSESVDTTSDTDLYDHGSIPPRRNELEEAQKFAADDTKRLRLWRLVVTGVLLVTAFVITFITYTLLQRQEVENFETAFFSFASTLGDAAVDHQRRMRQAYVGFAYLVSSGAYHSNATWPMYRIPDFELHAGQVRAQSGSEVVGFSSFVEPQDADEYLEYITANYEDSSREGHLIRYGNLDRLIPMGYQPNFTVFLANGTAIPDEVERPVRSATWQNSPPVSFYYSFNWDLLTFLDWKDLYGAAIVLKNESVITPVSPYADGGVLTKEEHDAMHSTLPDSDASFPHSFIMHPVHQIPGDYESKIVGWTGAGFAWDFALRNLLPENINGIRIEVRNSCNQTCIYEIDGKDAFYLGENATHDSTFDHLEVVRDLSLHTHPNFTTTPGHCRYTIHIFPTATFYSIYETNTPEVYAAVVAFTFVLVALVFLIYDILVRYRNNKMVVNTAKVNAVVSDMFPDAIRDRLLNSNDDAQGSKTGTKAKKDKNSKPLADLFLETTVMFADIAGFTAWSSVRDPSQVFSLLETLFNAFDLIAKRRNVFKVETVADCYVAVAGVPTPQKDHAVIMARFARDILKKMNEMTKKLETTFGLGTEELRLRIGLHSGPVTGGVLRGERSRFQLFGDTMNTGSRMESTGDKGRIHVSEDTAKLLMNAGKQSWLKQREQCIVVKGKGSMQTYWLTSSVRSDTKSVVSATNSSIDDVLNMHDDVSADVRLIDWNVEQLTFLLKQVVARRSTTTNKNSSNVVTGRQPPSFMGKAPIDEVQEIITLPGLDRSSNQDRINPNDVVISSEVVEQMKQYVTWVASMYRNNPFHNFHHASHVLMSVMKLMSRIVAPTNVTVKGDVTASEAAVLHDHTYGITSDPLTQFACAFSAMIHDLDHTGVPNATLVQEGVPIAEKYNNRSVAEQNSLDLAWGTLMENEKYSKFRNIIVTNDDELVRFRHLVVNCVMATDIADKELKNLRNQRWDKAFHIAQSGDGKDDISTPFKAESEQEQRDSVNRKATIVIEHLIQASDVSHTMQHWHVFRKWNECLFEEMYLAYKAGRSEKNPIDFWYQGEIGFFDFYILPLTSKLKDCGIFGVSSDEYYNYAKQNRNEWILRGNEIVLEMEQRILDKLTTMETSVLQKQQPKLKPLLEL